MRIAIGCPVRNRAWILPEYLEAISRISWPDKDYIFLANDCTDNTLVILQDFAQKHKRTTLESVDFGTSISEERKEYGTDNYRHMADVRNRFIELFLHSSNADYLLSIDSDIIAPQTIIKDLHRPCSANKYIISGAPISNMERMSLDGYTAGNFMMHTRGTISFIHPKKYPLTGMYDVDMVGAVSLIPRKLLQDMYNDLDGEIYSPHPQGEDLGFTLNVPYNTEWLVNMDCRPEHRMEKPKA